MRATKSSTSLELAEVLNTELRRARSVNSRYSLRAFAKRLEIQPSHLNEIIKRERPVGVKLGQRIVGKLNLSDKKKAILVKSLQASSLLKKQSQLFSDRLSLDQFSLISEWQHLAILSLLETELPNKSTLKISERLGLDLESTQASLLRLESLNLVSQTSRRQWRATGKSLTTPDRIPSAILCHSHAQDLKLARDALIDVKTENRDAASVTMAIDPKRLTSAIQMIRKFSKRLCAHLERGHKTEVYKMSLHLFPLSKIQSPKTQRNPK